MSEAISGVISERPAPACRCAHAVYGELLRMRMVRLAPGAAYASFAGLILRLGAAVYLAFLDPYCLNADQSNTVAQQIRPHKEPNSRIVLDPNGQQIAEIRWGKGRTDWYTSRHCRLPLARNWDAERDVRSGLSRSERYPAIQARFH